MPQLLRHRESIYALGVPPDALVAMAVKFPVVDGAQGNGELVGHLAREGCGLGELEVVGVGTVPAADQAGLRGHEGEVA